MQACTYTIINSAGFTHFPVLNIANYLLEQYKREKRMQRLEYENMVNFKMKKLELKKKILFRVDQALAPCTRSRSLLVLSNKTRI